jgi:hypothetical protein
LEPAPLALKLSPQFPVIVDLAVKDDARLAVDAHHGLRARIRKVDDGEPSMTKTYEAVSGHPHPFAIRPATPLGPVDGR